MEMIDKNGTELAAGDTVKDFNGTLWTVAEIPPTIVNSKRVGAVPTRGKDRDVRYLPSNMVEKV